MDGKALQSARRKSKTQKYMIKVHVDSSEDSEIDSSAAENKYKNDKLSPRYHIKRSSTDILSLSGALTKIQNLQSIVANLDTKASSQTEALCSTSDDETFVGNLEYKIEIINQRRVNSHINKITNCQGNCLIF
ncbi:hypothetical protein SteCoe_10508 [Stentor coeruleus]|uniref:Uncharacterized protein n=1 Tax=Stentor coeruleus TaxID=5963 RepID=A0A1R2CFG8_9CILI|nr:hypothetical protein SteCoe_10508 [Stentor coeruleus]